MKDLTGYALSNALYEIQRDGRYIIKLTKLIGLNRKFNDLKNPYVIRQCSKNNCINLYITYY